MENAQKILVVVLVSKISRPISNEVIGVSVSELQTSELNRGYIWRTCISYVFNNLT